MPKGTKAAKQTKVAKASKSAKAPKAQKATKKEKKVKDKNAPKRAMGAFFCYQKVRREQFIKEHPGLSNKEVISVSS